MTQVDDPKLDPSPSPEPHDHGHGHDHSHDDHAPPVDPAQQSLADALQVSFKILTFLMVLIILVYLGSGWFKVDAQNRAVKLRFGQIVGEPGQQVYGEGWHWGLPYPIEQVITVQVAPQTVNINQAFWYEVTEADAGKSASELAGRARPLNPEKDGSLLTGDASVVHARYRITYVIRDNDLVDYLENVYSANPNADNAEITRQLVAAAAERGIIHAVAQIEADEFIGGRTNQTTAQLRAQEVLDELNTGIQILTFSATNTQMPLPVFEAYLAVSNAESEKAQLIEAARQEHARILGETAGQAYDSLYQLVRDYELARAREDDEAAAALQTRLTLALANLKMPDDLGGQRIGGKVAEAINQANSFRAETVQAIRRAAENFSQLLTEYRRNPRILPARLWEQARIDVFSNPDIEILYVPTSQLEIITNRDPTVARERETRRLEAEQEAARERGQN